MFIFCVIIGIFALAVLGILLYHNHAYPEAVKIAGEMEHVGKDYYFRSGSDIGFIIFSGAKTDEALYKRYRKFFISLLLSPDRYREPQKEETQENNGIH